jgi:hypothetical protein
MADDNRSVRVITAELKKRLMVPAVSSGQSQRMLKEMVVAIELLDERIQALEDASSAGRSG